MKTHRIISFTICNALILLSFASILSSCEKILYPSSGFFSKGPSRTIASVRPPKQSEFASFQDPKQIYIYCNLNSKTPRECFEQQIQQSIERYEQKFGILDNQPEVLSSLDYDQMQVEIKEMLKNVSEEIKPEINKWVNTRLHFCKSNSKHLFKKCMGQNLEKDTFSVLNKFHRKNKLNGQEYLFLKKNIHQLISVQTASIQQGI